MFLKSLSLKGFKSFAETTSLEFEPGVTVVVGPNGSGKSNVVDAIGWVLGAQSPSTVRSQKMDDVIFAGTAKRQALGRAEVVLTIDNSAGLLPIEFSEVTVSRTLFRTGESEYALNGVPCRLLDIQELLSDTGVGRQQHVIVSQGQIDAVLNAKPEDRRLIIEEAAGVLKYRKRKEKSERRLASTEGNLTRLQDLLREVRRQLRPLERQADAARRHGALVSELQALRVFLAGRELHTLRSRLATTARNRREHESRETELRKHLSELDASVMAAEAELAAIGGDDLGDALVRFESLRERARGLGALLAERRRGLERERGASVDAEVIASLEAESTRLAGELADVERDAEAIVPETDELARREQQLAQAREAFQREWADGVPAPSGEAAETRGELAALRTAVERGESELARTRARLGALADRDARLVAEAERLRVEIDEAEAAEEPLVRRQADAEERRVRAERAVEVAEERRLDADAERHRWAARADALELALDEARSRAGAERLADTDGVVGALLDLVAVDAGWEAAFEAAAGEAVSAVVVDSTANARRAVAALRDGEMSGAVLALGARRPARPVPAVGEPVRSHVRALVPEVEDALDALIGGAVMVRGGWAEAVDAALAHPEAIVVTDDGDRFGTTGWRVGQAGTGATGAALDEARSRAEVAEADARQAASVLADARTELAEAARVEAEITQQLDDTDDRRTAAGEALQRVEGDRRDTSTEVEALTSHVEEVATRLERERERVAELDEKLPMLEAADAEAAEQARLMAEARERLDERARAVGEIRTDLEVRAGGLDDRRQFLTRRLAEVEERLAGNRAARDEAEARRVELDRKATALAAMAERLEARLAELDGALERLRARRRRQTEAQREQATALDGFRRERAEAESELEEVREHLRRAELDESEITLRIETSVETMRRDLDVEPDTAVEAECPELDEGDTPAARTRELERELRLMGPINPLALEEYDALQERHQFLQGQLEDVKTSRRELQKVIKAIDQEIVNVFASAYADVSSNFEQLFSTLFPGGRGKLELTEPDHLLETGIEINARPSGKNVRKLSLLSGGERSLTALAFLFAVFRSRPSPFYVMDEVEAALDDVNLHRFLDLVHEFRDEAQLLIVSHQKRTMEAADCLYGITMQPGGSSRAVSEQVAI